MREWVAARDEHKHGDVDDDAEARVRSDYSW